MIRTQIARETINPEVFIAKIKPALLQSGEKKIKYVFYN